MKSFLIKPDSKPLIPFSLLPDGIFYLGELPIGYSLAVCTKDEKQVVLDVDVKNGKNGFLYIPENILAELELTFNYSTKSGGHHYFLNYSGSKALKNTSTVTGNDLRIGANRLTGNSGGFVRYNSTTPVQEIEPLIKTTSPALSEWLESLFC